MNLKTKIRSHQVTIGSWVTIAHPSVIEILSNAGFDWLVIDMEHTSIDLQEAHNLIMTIQSKNIKALVRVSKNEEVIIKKVLDIGADGIIIPMINSKTDIETAINYAYYPPKGKRGVGLFRAQNYGLNFNEYKKWMEEELIVIAQIEHINAVNNIDDILAINELDGIIVGPYDLSSSMGYPGEYNREDVQNAINTIISRCKKFGKSAGFHIIESNPQNTINKIKSGCTFVAYSLDFFFLGDSARAGVLKIRNEIK